MLLLALSFAIDMGGTTDDDVVSLFNLDFVSPSAPDCHSRGKNLVDPPMRLSKVASSLCPVALERHSLLEWVHAPCVQQYLLTVRLRFFPGPY